MRKRLAVLACALAMMVGMVMTTGTASAGGKGPVALCQGHTWLPEAWNVVLPPGGELPWGYIDLCRNGDSYFAIYTHLDANGDQAPMPTGFYANAWIYRYYNGVYTGRSSCDGGDGNKHVVPGDTWCSTNSLETTDLSVTFRAAAFVYRWTGSEWALAASGWTINCNRHYCYDPDA